MMKSRVWFRCLAITSLYIAVSTAAGQVPAVERQALNGHTDSVLALAFSPNGNLLASAGKDKTVRLWEPTTGESIGVLAGHRYIVKALAFTPDGKTLISGAGQHESDKFAGELSVWDAANRRLKRTISVKPNNDVNSVACFPDGKLVASGGIDGISVWDIESGELKQSLRTDNSATLALAVSRDGQTLVSGSFDTLLRLWDTRTWTVKQTFKDHRSEIRATKLSTDGKTLATRTGGRKEAYVWDLEAEKLRRTITNQYDIESLALAPDGQTLAAAGHRQGSTTGRIELWDAGSGAPRGAIEDANGAVFALDFSSDGKTLASGGNGKAIKLWALSK
jgi:hypothetical protein